MDARHVDSVPRADMVEASEQNQAAEMIQRNYRGYRERRQLQGMGLDASTRWTEAVREGNIMSRPTMRHAY